MYCSVLYCSLLYCIVFVLYCIVCIACIIIIVYIYDNYLCVWKDSVCIHAYIYIRT